VVASSLLHEDALKGALGFSLLVLGALAGRRAWAKLLCPVSVVLPTADSQCSRPCLGNNL
jgi:hypothetical protein